MTSINEEDPEKIANKMQEQLLERNEMINNVVDGILTEDLGDNIFLDQVKDIHANVPLEERLDVKKLLEYYEKIMEEKRVVSIKNDFLNKALLKYFRLKKIFRAYFADNPDQLPYLIEKYFDLLNLMNEKIARRKFVETDSKNKFDNLSDKIKATTIETEDNINVLEKDLNSYGLSLVSSQTGKNLPQEIMDDIIKRMNVVRNQISGQRLVFIKTLDKHILVKEEAKCLEDLGNGLRMVDFEEMRAERQSLADKIEDRNNELAKLRKRCLADTLILAHVREKEVMVDSFVSNDSFNMGIIERERNFTRNYLNDMKIKLMKCRKEFADLSQKCGLLDKPDLLADFDNLTRQLCEKRLICEQLKRDTKQ